MILHSQFNLAFQFWRQGQFWKHVVKHTLTLKNISMYYYSIYVTNVNVFYFQKCQKVNLSVKCVCTKEPKTQDSSSIQLKEWVYSLEMFATDLVFSWDSGLIILCTLHEGECLNSWNDNYQITINGSLILFMVETVHCTCRNHGGISHGLSTNRFFNGNYQIPIHFSNNVFLQNLRVSVYIHH